MCERKMDTMGNWVIIGGGAAGMFAAICAAQGGNTVTLLEKNEKLGKKLYITGKGRCNLTNACPMSEIFAHITRNPRFLYSAFSAYTNTDIMDFFTGEGVRLKTERGGRVFPVSDHASDIIAALERKLHTLHVDIRLKTEVRQIRTENGRICAVVPVSGGTLPADRVIIACGGLSYPSTGSTGDGYRLSAQLGHTIVDASPSLVPLNVKESYIHRMQGLSLKNVTLTIGEGKKPIYEEFGELLFTHFGISGPLALTASTRLSGKLPYDDFTQTEKKNLHLAELSAEKSSAPCPQQETPALTAHIDLKPALTEEQLDARLLREFDQSPNKEIKNVIHVLFPSLLRPVILEAAKISPEKKIHDIGKEERLALLHTIKAFPLTITSLRGYNEAVITRGGVSVKEVDPKTMASRLVSGLHFAGEVLDVDAETGGYNLQIAWSTAHASATI